MAIFTSIWRFTGYFRRHGFGPTLRRTALALKRALFSNHVVLFYCDLARQTAPPVDLPSPLRVERTRSFAELSPEDLEQVTSFWHPKLAHRNIKERFGKGAILWLIKSEDSLAGYGWTLQGNTIEPHYFPLGEGDLHLFDFHVFPQYRGKGINPILVAHILRNLAADGGCRAFIEAAEWNKPQLSSLNRTPFRRLGRARKLTIFHQTLVCWAEGDIARPLEKGIRHRRPAASADSGVRGGVAIEFGRREK
jgi:ribosomal protein S18 acetylase RimI-like enzyme